MKTFEAIIKTRDLDEQGWESVESAQKIFENATVSNDVNIFYTADSSMVNPSVIYKVTVKDCRCNGPDLMLKLKLKTFNVPEIMVRENLVEALTEFMSEDVEILDLRETTKCSEEFDPTRVYSWFNADELRPGDVVYVSDYPAGLASAFSGRQNIGIIEQIKPSECGLRFIVRDKNHESNTSWAYAYLIERAPYVEPEEEPKLDVNVDVNIKSTSDVGSIKVQINGVEVTFKSVEDAKKVLSSLKED